MRKLLIACALLLWGGMAGTQDYIRYYPAGLVSGAKVNSLQIGDQASPYNSCLGFESCASITTAESNTAVGFRSLKSLTEGGNNTAVGYRAGMYLIGAGGINGQNNTLIGANAYIGVGEMNTVVGMGAAGNNSYIIASDTTAVGAQALAAIYGGMFNTAVGFQAMQNNRGQTAANEGITAVTGWNTALGYRAGWGTAAASEMNTFLGAKAGYGNTSGSNGILIGWQAGDSLTTGDGNIIIGNDVDGSAATVALEVNVGNVYRVASTAQALTDAAGAVASVTIPIATNGWAAGELSFTATSLSGSDQLVANGGRRWWASDTAGTPVCGINTIGTDGEGHSGGANTLICTWTNVRATTNCVLSVTCTNNLASTQAINLYRKVQLEKPNVVTFAY